jgi:FAD/FMN-containing dehydrogenase
MSLGAAIGRMGDERVFATLAAIIDGEVVLAGSPASPNLALGFNARWDRVNPRAVVRCATAADVAETIAFARRHNLEVVPRGGGHCFAGRSISPGIVLDMSAMDAVTVVDGVARIGAGARLGEVLKGLLAHGLTIPGGSCPAVGIAGLTLGGGLGVLGRARGLTADALVAARIVLADGRMIECDPHHDADLFWALRGAGSGRLGVVTELAFRPFPVPRTTSFELTWPFAIAMRVVRAWLDWLVDAPDEIAPSLVISAGTEPGEPPTVEVFGTLLGSHSEALQLLEAFTSRSEFDPAASRIQEISYEQMLRLWSGRSGGSWDDPRTAPTKRSYLAIRSQFFGRQLPDAAIHVLLDYLALDRRAGQTRELDFTPWGGAYGRMPADAAAFVHRDARFLLKHTAGVAPDASATEKTAARIWADGSSAIVHRWGTGRVFPNFAEPGLDSWDRAYFGVNRDRLLEIKARYDPDGVFSTEHRVARGAAPGSHP